MKYLGNYRAKVLGTDAAETDKLGRIKVEVYPMLIGTTTAANLTGVTGIEIEQLPWAVPAMPIFAGASNAGPTSSPGCFIVPEVGSFVWVFFENGDIYQPVYFAEAQTAEAGVPAERLTGYPYTKVWKSTGGVVITINDSDGNQDIKVLHPTGTYIQIDKDGNLLITSVGTSTINSSGALAITAPRIDLN